MDENKVKEALAKLEEEHVVNLEYAKSLHEAKELLRQALAPKQRFYKGQPVLVRDYDDAGWYLDILMDISMTENAPYECRNGTWRQCKPDLDAVPMLNWIEHDGGAMPVAATQRILALLANGSEVYREACDFTWQKESAPYSYIKRYAIVKLPEFIGE